MRLSCCLLFSLPHPYVNDDIVADATARKGWGGGGRQAAGVRQEEDATQMQASATNRDPDVTKQGFQQVPS